MDLKRIGTALLLVSIGMPEGAPLRAGVVLPQAMRPEVTPVAGTPAPSLALEPIPGLDEGGDEGSPRLSPDGRWIAYQADRDGDLDILIAPLPGRLSTSERSPATPVAVAVSPANEARPAWSPDGSQLVFASDRGGSWDLWRVDRDGGGLRRLTSTAGTESAPHWSVRGEIVFHADTGGSWDLWTIDSDGGEPRRLTDHPGNEYHPRWSPDGSRVVFYSTWSGWTDLWLFDVAARTLVPISVSEQEDYFPSWSPDGRYVIFQSDRAGDPELTDIWAVPAAGGTPRSIARVAEEVRFLDWAAENGTLVAEVRIRQWALFEIATSGGVANPVTAAAHRALDPEPLPTGPSEAGRFGARAVLFSSDYAESERHLFLAPLPERSPDGAAGILAPSIDAAVDAHKLTLGRMNHERPRVSPDGRHLAYVAGGGDYASFDLFVRPLSEGPGRRLTSLGNVRHPAWCGDGSTLVFSHGAVSYAGDRRLWSVDVATGATRRIGDIVVVDSPSDCSRTGSTVLYSAMPAPSSVAPDPGTMEERVADLDVFALDLADGAPRRLTESGGNDIDAGWSPDGRRIVFASDRSGNYEIWIMSADGDDVRQLTETGGAAGQPRFAADGTSVVYRLASRSTRLARLDGAALLRAIRAR